MTPAPANESATLGLRVEIETPEQVAFSYELAGIGSRATALMIDYAICFIPGVLFFAAVMATFASVRRVVADGAWLFAFVMLAQFAVFWGYHVLFEGLRDGQTPGKRRLGLRVVMDGGFGVTFGASAVRNIARVIDMQPALLHAVAVIAAGLSPRGKRLGDMLAGTMVVQEKLVPLTPHRERAAVGEAPAESLLTDQEYAVLEQWVSRRNALDPERRRMLAETLHARFAGRVPGVPGASAMASLLRLHEQERDARARGAAGRGASGAAREKHRLVAQGQPRWSAFASMVARAQSRGLGGFGEQELAEFAARYRDLAADLARLRTASDRRESPATFALGRLVAAGHNVLYRRKPPSLRAAAAFLSHGIPAEVRRSALPIALASAMLFVPMAAAWIAVVRHPPVALDILPAGMIDRAEDAVARARLDAGYIDIGEAYRPLLASGVIANNIQVAFGAFALGMTAGLGTAFVLIVNGTSIGGALGLYASKGVLPVILSFIAPHGVLELSAIAIAGGAGLLVGSAILIPGALTRREALVERGSRAIRLVAGTIVLLLVAGTIEGLFSPSYWPFEAKLFVSAMTAIALAIWLTRGRGAATAPTAP